MRTAYDLARWHDLVEGVVAVDALARKGRFGPDMLLHVAARYPRARNHRRVADVLVHANRSSGSPMESRLRMLIVLAGLPRPVVQHPVQDERARRAVWLDLAYPEHMIGIEYEGEVHACTERVLRDVGRYTRLVDKGRRIYRYTKFEIYTQQQRILDEVGRALERAR